MLRAAPELAATLIVKLPLPVPVLAGVAGAQAGRLTVQVHVGAAVTVPVAVPPAAVKDVLLMETVGAVGHGCPSCVKEKAVFRPIATIWPEPLRAVPDGFAATV